MTPRVFVADSLGSVLEMAESLGWVDRFPDATHPDWRPTMADDIEEDAIAFIEAAGYRVVFGGGEEWGHRLDWRTLRVVKVARSMRVWFEVHRADGPVCDEDGWPVEYDNESEALEAVDRLRAVYR